MGQQVCVVFGVGPGLGEATARGFANAGWSVAVIARSADKVEAIAADIGGHGYTADATDAESVREVLQTIASDLGPIHTLCWNVGSATWGGLDAIDLAGMDVGFGTNARGLFVAAKTIVPAMREAGSGNILITGATASLRGKPATTAFAAGKAAQRSLAQSLARELWPDGIHVALVIVDGLVDLPRTRKRAPELTDAQTISPAAYADTLLFLARQDPRAWTFQLEVRPAVENW